MALINCPKCDKKISDTAENCIGYGYSLKLTKMTTKKTDKESISILNEVQENGNNLKNKENRILINILVLILIIASLVVLYILNFEESPDISSRWNNNLMERILIWRTQVYICAYVLITALASLVYFNKR